MNVLPCKSYERRFLLTGLRSLRLLKSMTATTQVTLPLMCAWGPAGLRLVGDTLSLLPAEDVSRGCLSLESNLEGGVGGLSMKKGRIGTCEQRKKLAGQRVWAGKSDSRSSKVNTFSREHLQKMSARELGSQRMEDWSPESGGSLSRVARVPTSGQTVVHQLKKRQL